MGEHTNPNISTLPLHSSSRVSSCPPRSWHAHGMVKGAANAHVWEVRVDQAATFVRTPTPLPVPVAKVGVTALR